MGSWPNPNGSTSKLLDHGCLRKSIQKALTGDGSLVGEVDVFYGDKVHDQVNAALNGHVKKKLWPKTGLVVTTTMPALKQFQRSLLNPVCKLCYDRGAYFKEVKVGGMYESVLTNCDCATQERL